MADTPRSTHFQVGTLQYRGRLNGCCLGILDTDDMRWNTTDSVCCVVGGADGPICSSPSHSPEGGDSSRRVDMSCSTSSARLLVTLEERENQCADDRSLR